MFWWAGKLSYKDLVTSAGSYDKKTKLSGTEADAPESHDTVSHSDTGNLLFKQAPVVGMRPVIWEYCISKPLHCGTQRAGTCLGEALTHSCLRLRRLTIAVRFGLCHKRSSETYMRSAVELHLPHSYRHASVTLANEHLLYLQSMLKNNNGMC